MNNLPAVRAQPVGRRVDWSTWPVCRVDAENRAAGLLLTVIGVVWVGFFLLGGLHALLSPFAWIGAVIGILGLHLLLVRKRIVLDRDHVQVRTFSLLGRKEWSEPLQAYRGVMLRSVLRHGGQNQSSYREYLIELEHPDLTKKVVLYRSRKERGWHQTWMEASRELQLPAIEEGVDGAVVHAPEDLGKSVAEKAREGALTVAFDPKAPPPAGLAMQVEGGELLIRIVRKNWRTWGVLIGFLVGVIFLVVGLSAGGGAEFLFAIIGGIVCIGMLGLVVKEAITERRIKVGSGSLTLSLMTPWGEQGQRVLAAEKIRALKVGHSDTQNTTAGLAVQVLTDEGRVTLGAGLPRPALDWLKDFLTASLARM